MGPKTCKAMINKDTYAQLERLNPKEKRAMSRYMAEMGFHRNSISKMRSGMVGSRSAEAIQLMIIDLGLVTSEGQMFCDRVSGMPLKEQAAELKLSTVYEGLDQMLGKELSTLIKKFIDYAHDSAGTEAEGSEDIEDTRI